MYYRSTAQRLLLLGSLFLTVHLLTADAATAQQAAKVGPAAMVLPYEGYLADADGHALPDGHYDLTFTLYATPDGGTPLWTGEYKQVAVEGGFVHLELGSGETPLDLPFDQPYYLSVRLGTDEAMQPRLKLPTAAYSFRARVADEVAPGSITDAHVESISWDKITGVPETVAEGSLPLQGAGKGAGDGARQTAGSPCDGCYFWAVRGNAGTIPGSHFIGTSDNKDVIFKTKNKKRMTITKSGAIDIKNDLDIGNDLDVDNDAHIGNNLTVEGLTHLTNTTESTGTTNGALTVDGGVGIAARLNVGGDGLFGLNVGIGGALDVGGAVDVDGATTLNSSLDVDGATTLNNTLDVDGAAALHNTLDVDGVTTLNNTAASDDPVLVVKGSTDINADLEVGGTTSLDGTLTLSTEGDIGPDGSDKKFVAFFENTDDGTKASGVAIQIHSKVDPPLGASYTGTASTNDYVAFFDGNDVMTGRIEGYAQPVDFLDVTTVVNEVVPAFTDLIDSGGMFGRGGLPDVDDLNWDPGELSSINFLTSFFDAGELSSLNLNNFNPGSLPSFDLLSFSPVGNDDEVAEVIEPLMCWALDHDLQSLATTNPFDLALAASVILANEACKDGGVTFASGAADYAEWMPKLDADEPMVFGQIVGVHGGKITKTTEGADQILSLSLNPIVLGNLPPEGEEGGYEKVAFMGQVPVLVTGQVNLGDYIVPSGDDNGIGVAIAPGALRLEHMNQVVGRAISDAPDGGLSVINVLIGVRTNEWVEIITRQQAQIDALEAQLTSLETVHARLASLEARLTQHSGAHNTTVIDPE